MKKLLALSLATIMGITMLVGCGSGDSSNDSKGTGNNTQSNNESGLKVALCVSGSVNDNGWNQQAYEGLVKVEENFGCETAYTENLGVADIVAAYTDYAAAGYDVIIGHGYEFGDAAIEVGEQYPDVKFVVIEGEVSADNVASYVMSCEEGGYIMGMLAASISESDVIGFVGPMQGASLVKIMNGFEDGAKEVNSNIEVQTAWTESFTDMALAKEAAKAMIDNGADVIGHCANEGGTGAINAAKEAGIYATGDSYDQNALAENTILSSSIYNVPVLVEDAIKDVIDGNFVGEICNFGMAEGVVEVAPYHNLDSNIPQEVKDLISNRIEEIKNGSFDVPCDTTPRT